MRYYFIRDRVELDEVVITHCLTTEMLGDHFTKLLQGELISKFRAKIINIPDDINMDDMGMSGTCTKKGFMWKLHNYYETKCPQEFVGECDIVSARNGANSRVFGPISRVRKDTNNGMVFCEKEVTRELWSYADVTKWNYERTPEQ